MITKKQFSQLQINDHILYVYDELKALFKICKIEKYRAIYNPVYMNYSPNFPPPYAMHMHNYKNDFYILTDQKEIDKYYKLSIFK